MLSRLFRRSRGPDPAVVAAYAAIVAQARRPEFYACLGVPDTVDGRFDLLALHAYLVMRRLKGQGPEAQAFSQALFDHMVADLDEGVRQLGAADTGVGKRVKAMVRGIYGRIVAYDRGLAAAGDAALVAALDRNLYGTVVEVPEDRLVAMAGYLRQEAAGLEVQPLARLLAGEVGFGAPPAGASADRYADGAGAPAGGSDC